MAAFFKAVNAKIRANPMLSYVCSTRTFEVPLLSSTPWKGARKQLLPIGLLVV
jgi:hypothetical protein